jgi:hypothetical protein
MRLGNATSGLLGTVSPLWMLVLTGTMLKIKAKLFLEAARKRGGGKKL